MNIQGSSFLYGQNGLQGSQNRLDQASQKVAQASTQTVNQRNVNQNEATTNNARYGSPIQDGLIEAKQSALESKANAKVIDASNKTIGSLIDIKV
ncbi:hypothetical protein [Marinomonas spartinae]|uniref:hypothetical protein n=1 Tax=Marinomonas spartinae TaxID=1792290 RepID=UPI0018F1B551|nr:hypothetical protein [Marinomonas spartinae]MBJ7553521.1 hypothetical protein [Marinomonas spartinae]